MAKSTSSSLNEWRNALSFVPEAGKDPGVITAKYIQHNKLRKTLDIECNLDEIIQCVYKYKIVDIQPSFMAHVLLVFKTEQYWWSIEKDSKVIILQRGTDVESVRDFITNNRRRGNIKQKTVSECGTLVLRDLVKWLYYREELKKVYRWWNRNCKKFARELFNFIVNNFEKGDDSSLCSSIYETAYRFFEIMRSDRGPGNSHNSPKGTHMLVESGYCSLVQSETTLASFCKEYEQCDEDRMSLSF